MSEGIKVSLLGVVCLTLTMLSLWAINTTAKVDSYSLIVVDRTEMEWAVDYNLTRQDCERMAVSEASYCARQPEGKLP